MYLNSPDLSSFVISSVSVQDVQQQQQQQLN
jgi:hypothetical protein